MAINIPSADISPRNDNGILKFYEGDTFKFNLMLELKDQDNEDVILDSAKDEVQIVFYNYKNKIIKSFDFGKDKTNAIGEGNLLELEFDKDTSAFFEKGKYTYDGFATIEGIGRRTIINRAPVLVE